MSYVCRKTINLSGVEYRPGDVIPDGAILPSRERTLKAVGMISEVGENADVPVVAQQQEHPDSELSTISIPVKGENGEITLEVTPEDVQEVFSVLQMTASEGITEIAKVTSNNVLILIHATDSRKTVQNAANERADILNTEKQETKAPSGSDEATGGSDDGKDSGKLE